MISYDICLWPHLVWQTHAYGEHIFGCHRGVGGDKGGGRGELEGVVICCLKMQRVAFGVDKQ